MRWAISPFNADRCPSPEALSRVLEGVAELRVLQHVEHCERCAATLRALRELESLTGELALEEPSAEHHVRQRARLLAAAEDELASARRWRQWRPLLAVAAVLLFLGGGLWFVGGTDRARPLGPAPSAGVEAEPVTHRAVLHPRGEVQLAYVSELPDERVRLHSGTLHLEVSPLQEGERFRVLVGEAEIEVHGTAFDVVAVDDDLREVRVLHGIVEVRAAGEPPVFLGAGERWAPSPPVETEPPPPVEPPQGEGAVAVEATPQPLHPEGGDSSAAAEEAFRVGWEALGAGQFEAADRALEQVGTLAPDSPLVEDAAYWLIVTKERRGEHDRAEQAARQYLSDFPTGAHRAEASLLLAGWLVQEGAYAEARAAFEVASGAADASVRQAALQGLERLDRLSP